MKYTRVILILFSFLLLTACQSQGKVLITDSSSGLPVEVATLVRTADSPSGRFTLQVVQPAEQKQSFIILDSSGKQIFAAAEQFSTRHKTYFLWDSKDRVWVDAGNEGIYFWYEKEGEWVKTDQSAMHEPLPSFLEQAHPVER